MGDEEAGGGPRAPDGAVEKKKRRKVWPAILLLALATIGLAVGLGVGLGMKNKNNNESTAKATDGTVDRPSGQGSEPEKAAEESTNPLLFESAQLPRFSIIEPSHITPAMTAILSQLEENLSALETSLSEEGKEVVYDDVLPIEEKIVYPLHHAWKEIVEELLRVKNSDEIRAAFDENEQKVVEAFLARDQSKPVYNALLKIREAWGGTEPNEDDDFLTLQKKRAVEIEIRRRSLAGVGLEEKSPEHARFKQIKTRLAKLGSAFRSNVSDAKKAFGLDVADPLEMVGVPESAKALWAKAYQMHHKVNNQVVDPDDGPWRITLDAPRGPSYQAAMNHLPSRELRKKIYMAYVTLTKDVPGKSNVPIIEEILQLRKEMSGLLGFRNYAEVSLASKMAPDVEAVSKLAQLFHEKSLPAAEEEIATAIALARETGGEEYSEANFNVLLPWDESYLFERLREQSFDLKEEELRPYFSLDVVLKGMFELIDHLFNVEVREANGKAEVWHPDVRFFELYDNDSGAHVASFYLDPYSRPENKQGPPAWFHECLSKSDAVGINIPVAYLVCKGSPPDGDKPSLMTFDEVKILFHEAGHGLQHMLTKATVGYVAGLKGIPTEATELPSQFMENWCYDRDTVSGFAKHYETGEALLEEVFEKLQQQRMFKAGVRENGLLYKEMLDMELHSNYDPYGNETIFDVQRRIANIYTPYAKQVEGDCMLCSFDHIAIDGYAAGYYSYRWAEVMSADAFGAFEEVGLDNDAGVRELGRRFRDTALSLGGGVAPMDVFKRFRGREPSPEALLRHIGLA